ncbi:cytochrome P450 [Psychromicrobium lacuslunae]|uniref:Cytochrome P450 n=2 Tax=Psychromicrobium lacuslunae TaxID=1618207 RepID=A0A0D4C1R7_9MICC|nr:cytochrome P450 [Psychromicrobium lacuslunae]
MNLRANDPDFTEPTTFLEPNYLDSWRRARREHPIIRLESERHGQYWSVTSHAPARQILEKAEIFISSEGMRIGGHQSSVGAAANRMLVVADGASHQRIRAAHSPWFTAKNAKALGEVLRDQIEKLIEPLITGESIDVVDKLADAIPTCVMGQMMGTPAEETELLSELVRSSFDETTLDDPARKIQQAAASSEVFSYFTELVAWRAEEPGEDIVSLLTQASMSEGSLSHDEVLLNCDGLVNGGLGTSRHAVSAAILAFASNPEQWQRLRADRTLVRSAVEEILRWASPPMHVMRTVSADVEIDGVKMKAGDRVVIWIPSCNRDETVFDNPDEFRIDRRPNPHLSLGGGPHYCIGAAIGRTEIRVLLEVLLERVARMDLSDAPVPSASAFLNGFDKLEVRLFPLSQVQVVEPQ